MSDSPAQPPRMAPASLELSHSRVLSLLTPCRTPIGALEWVRSQSGLDAQQLWEACPRGDWLLELATQVGIRKQLLVLAACACARLTLQYVTKGEERPLRALETAAQWAIGEPAVTVDQVREARSAAVAAAAASSQASYGDTYEIYAESIAYVTTISYAFDHATDARDAAASSFAAVGAATDDQASAPWETVTHAADAASAGAHKETGDYSHIHRLRAREKMQLECAHIVRRHIPFASVMEAVEALLR